MDLEVSTPVTDWDVARSGGNGVSVMCISDYDTGIYTFYGGDTLEDGAIHLEDASCIVTFNGQGFDIPCLEGVLGRSLRLQGHYDILAEIREALGQERVKGTGLGPTCERTLGVGKLQSGERAPELFQKGKFPELYSYCFHDVYLTTLLFNHVMDFGFVVDPSGEKLCLRLPEYEEKETCHSKNLEIRHAYHREYHRKWRKGEKHISYIKRYLADPENKARQKVRFNEYWKKRREWINSFKNVPCLDCGKIFPPECMDFDHVRDIKLFSIKEGQKHPKDVILKEMAKCEVICANCHRIRTKNRQTRNA